MSQWIYWAILWYLNVNLCVKKPPCVSVLMLVSFCIERNVWSTSHPRKADWWQWLYYFKQIRKMRCVDATSWNSPINLQWFYNDFTLIWTVDVSATWKMGNVLVRVAITEIWNRKSSACLRLLSRVNLCQWIAGTSGVMDGQLFMQKVWKLDVVKGNKRGVSFMINISFFCDVFQFYVSMFAVRRTY